MDSKTEGKEPKVERRDLKILTLPNPPALRVSLLQLERLGSSELASYIIMGTTCSVASLGPIFAYLVSR